jgi:hypothetical protein
MEEHVVIVTTEDVLERVVAGAVRSALESYELPQHSGKRLLSAREVSEEYGIGKRTLELWRHEGTGPEYTTVGGRIMYERAMMEKYLKAGRVRPMSGIRRM